MMMIMKMKFNPAATTFMLLATITLLLLAASVSASSTTTNHHQRIPFVRATVKTTTITRSTSTSTPHVLALSEDNTQQLDVLLHWQQQQRRRRQERQQQRSLALRQILRRHPASGSNNYEVTNEIQV